jgi:hypothetical protein
MDSMHYIGLDIHKKTISFCVKQMDGTICLEGAVPARRRDLNCWMKTFRHSGRLPWRRRSSAAGSTII